MTIAYTLDIATSSFFTQFKVLFRWKGSVWQSVWKELVAWCALFIMISLIYRILLNADQRRQFEEFCTLFDNFSVFIPVTFMLGFYLNIVYNRWNKYMDNIGFIDTVSISIAQFIDGSTERARIIRRNCVRYLIVAQVLVYRDISVPIRRRFPTMQHLVSAGLLWQQELDDFDSVKSTQAKFWLPITWACTLVKKAHKEGLIGNHYEYVDLISRIRDFRAKIISLVVFDLIPIPLVYTQVVMIAVRSYFFVALFGRQFIEHRQDIGGRYKLDIFFPILSALQVVFIVGWLKVSEVMLNPFGEDDEDFESNWVIDRNFQVGYSVVDQGYEQCPDVVKDPFWEEDLPEVSYGPEAERRKQNPMQNSAVGMDSDEESGFTGIFNRRRSTVSDIMKKYKTSGQSFARRVNENRKKIRHPSQSSEEEDRRRSVCVAALNLNQRTDQQSEPVGFKKSASTATVLSSGKESVGIDKVPSESEISKSSDSSKQIGRGKVFTVEIPEEQMKSSVTEPNDGWFIGDLPVIQEEDSIHKKTT